MPLYLKKGDITQISCDAIVNATDEYLSGGGGVDYMIHSTGGKGLDLECEAIGGCKMGKAVITRGYELPARYVIHTVGPVWSGNDTASNRLLADCYKNSLALAWEYGCESIAFPLISAGTFGYPEDDALIIAKTAIEDFLCEHDMQVYLVAYRSHTYNLGEKLFEDLNLFLKMHYVDSSPRMNVCATESFSRPSRVSFGRREVEDACFDYGSYESCPLPSPKAKQPQVLETAKLEDMLKQVDESFCEMLLRKIGERGISNADCYNGALVTKSVFSKIKNNPEYRPTKPTVAGFVLALKLPLEEAKEMLAKAGYSMSRSNKFDIILEWFITNGRYDVYEINEVLLEYDQLLIGF